MKYNINLLIGGLSAALLSLASAAQPAAPGTAGAQASEPSLVGACGKARDPQRCEALQKAKDACKDKATVEKRKCIMDAMPPMDCSKARSPQRCEAVQKAKDVCKDKVGPEHRQCMKESMPKRGGKAAPKG